MENEIKVLDMEVQVAHEGSKASTCTTSGKSSDCCWHDCKQTKKVYQNATFFGIGLSTCMRYSTVTYINYSTNAFA